MMNGNVPNKKTCVINPIKNVYLVNLKAKYQNLPIHGNRKTPKNNWKLILNIHLTYIIKYTY